MEERVDLQRKVLRINVDETAVRFYVSQRAGLVAKRRRGGPSLAQDASRRQQRSCLARVAAVCDDPAAQPYLPQVFVGNEKVFQLAAVKLVQPALRKHAILVRRKSGWGSEDFLELRDALGCVPGAFRRGIPGNSAVGRPARALPRGGKAARRRRGSRVIDWGAVRGAGGELGAWHGRGSCVAGRITSKTLAQILFGGPAPCARA